MQHIEDQITEYTDALESDDPTILAKLNIEVQLATMRLLAYQLQSINARLTVIEERANAIDWKLWEMAKITVPSLVADTVIGQDAVTIRDDVVATQDYK